MSYSSIHCPNCGHRPSRSSSTARCRWCRVDHRSRRTRSRSRLHARESRGARGRALVPRLRLPPLDDGRSGTLGMTRCSSTTERLLWNPVEIERDRIRDRRPARRPAASVCLRPNPERPQGREEAAGHRNQSAFDRTLRDLRDEKKLRGTGISLPSIETREPQGREEAAGHRNQSAFDRTLRDLRDEKKLRGTGISLPSIETGEPQGREEAVGHRDQSAFDRIRRNLMDEKKLWNARNDVVL